MPSVLDRVFSRRKSRDNKRLSKLTASSTETGPSQANGVNAANGVSASNGANSVNGVNGTTTSASPNGAGAWDMPAAQGSVQSKTALQPNGYTPVKSEGESHSRYPEPPDHAGEKVDLAQAISNFTSLVSHSMRSLPERTGDGTYVNHDKKPGLFKDLSTIGIGDLKTLKEQLEVGAGPVDDKTMLMERVIQLVASLPDRSTTRNDLTNKFVDQLFYSLPHPPLSYLGDTYKYRQADGSYNNIMYPHIGAANMPYARTVNPESIQPGALPDPGVIFDSVFARHKFRPHPNKNSSVIFYWASLIIHDCFQTNHHNYSMSETSSYLDLSPLYGDTQEDQDQIRTFKDGLLKPDCFSEDRLLAFPPGCGVLLIMFNRFHNHVATTLQSINEGGKFTRPKDDAPEQSWKKFDNDLFQTARLVTCGLYMNITLIDYVRTIINLTRTNSQWTLDPRVKMKDNLYDRSGVHTEAGVGNQVSCEFSMVYRWHSAISEKDEKWTEELFKQMWGKPASDITMPELLGGLAKWAAEMPKDPSKRPFNNMKRGPDGKFSDDELAEIMAQSVEDVAGSFGPNHIPKCLKAVDILGMKQARAWEVASLNEFRKFFGLKIHETFESISSDPIVADQLKHLYDHPDRVELYTGLVAEDAKMPMSDGDPVGVGICPTYTISRAILSDAVALVRGDRFYTIDYNPRHLTNWGYSEVDHDYNVEQGCSFYKLFIRALPNHFKPNSIYAHMPMTVPEENRKIMQNLGRESHYSWDRPARIPDRVLIQNYRGVRQVLEDSSRFKVTWGEATSYIFGKEGWNFMLSGDNKFHAQQKERMAKSLYFDEWHQHVKEFYEETTLNLIREKTSKIGGVNQVDITRDVGNLAHVHFAASIFSLPLKTKEHPHGIYSEQELYLVIAAIFTFIFFDVDPVKTFPLALTVQPLAAQLCKIVLANVKWLSGTSFISSILSQFDKTRGPLSDYGVHMIRRLLESGQSAEEIVYSQIMPTAVAMVPNQAQVFTQALDYYLLMDGKKHWPEIQRIAHDSTPESDDQILRYVMEGIRLNGTFGSYREAQTDYTLNDEGFSGQVNVKPKDKVFVSFVKANRDPEKFPNPDEVRLDRDMDNYIHYGVGPHTCLGAKASQVALTAMFKTVAKLNGLRPAPGPQGQLKKVPRSDGFYAYMTEDWGKFFPFPTTWKLHYDGSL